MAQLEHTWSTAQTQPGKALSYWKDVICENLLDLQIDSAQQANFQGHIAKCSLGALKANFISVSQQRVWRSRQSSRCARDTIFHLIHVRRGIQFVEHCGKSLKLEPGDCLLVDCLSGFKFDFPEGVDALVLEIRKDWIQGWLPVPEEAAGQVFGRKPGWGATLSSALGNLMPATIGDLSMPDSAIAEQIAVLLGNALCETNAIANEIAVILQAAREKSSARGFHGSWKITDSRMIDLEGYGLDIPLRITKRHLPSVAQHSESRNVRHRVNRLRGSRFFL